MNTIANILLQGEIIGDAKVLSLKENEIVIELQIPVFDDRTYQIQIQGNQYNLEFTQINGTIQKNKPVSYQARGFIFS